MGDLGFSVVIPSLSGAAEATVASVRRQVPPACELEVVVGVRPSGRARNLGVRRTTAPVVVFVDDDAVLGDDDTLAGLVAPLADPSIGVVGAAKVLPPGSSPFQRAVARQVPRIVHPVVDHLTDVNPPVGRHGYTDVTTTCCAVRRDVLERCGGFDPHLDRGVDSELFARVRASGFRLVLAPRTWAEHPAPATLPALLAKHFWYGIGYAQTVQRHPHLAAGRYLRTPLHAVGYLAARTALLPAHAVLPYSFARPSWRVGFRPLGALSSHAAALGYVYGWYRYPYRSPAGRSERPPDGPPGGRRHASR
jgi:GT2 family glycosyltransferase